MTQLLVVGELMSQADEGQPFSDGNGRFLKAIMKQNGIDPRRAKYTTVFKRTAPRGSVFSLCGPKTEGIPFMPYLKRGKYVKARYETDLRQLWKQVNHLKPNLILALGDAALWALTHESTLLSARGYVTEGREEIGGAKVLPTWHPRDIQRDYASKPYWYADLDKAAREMQWPDLRRPSHEIWLEPSLTDMEDFLHEYIVPCEYLSVDIENKPEFITCVGFAPSPERAIVIPFYDSRKANNSYWPTLTEEVAAWRWIRRVLSMGKAVGGHNYIYDMQHLWRRNAVPNPDMAWDTMLLHHAMQPELKKSLGMLASLYTDEVSWKGMRTETLKKED